MGEYKIPKIEEFIDGFIFEIYSEGYWEEDIEDFCGWYEYTMGKDNWREIEDLKDELKKGNIRAKISSFLTNNLTIETK